MDKNERHKSFYFVVAVVGLVLLMLEIGIYQKTIISFKIPFVVTLIVALVTFFIIQRDYKRTYQNKSFFFPFAQSVVSFGFIACYLFMAANYYFANNEIATKAFPILTKHAIGTGNSRQPTAEIEYDGTEKQLVFYNGQQQQLDTSKEVVLTIKKGLFGFDIFSDITLK